MKRNLWALLGLFALGAAVEALFLYHPEIDLIVSGWFYDSASRSFLWEAHPVARGIQKGVSIVAWTWGVVMLITFTCSFFTASAQWVVQRFPFSRRQWLFLILALALGPGLLVHQGFKDHFGRARPAAIQAFGGTEVFIPPFIVGEGDGKSFISGHAATGFYFAALAFVLRRRRGLAYSSGILVGLSVGACRILQGRHFLSDVLFSGLLMLALFHLLALALLREKEDGGSGRS